MKMSCNRFQNCLSKKNDALFPSMCKHYEKCFSCQSFFSLWLEGIEKEESPIHDDLVQAAQFYLWRRKDEIACEKFQKIFANGPIGVETIFKKHIEQCSICEEASMHANSAAFGIVQILGKKKEVREWLKIAQLTMIPFIKVQNK